MTTDEAVAAGPDIYIYVRVCVRHCGESTLRMRNPINLTGERQEEPQQPVRGGRSESDSDVDSDHGDVCFFFRFT